MIQLNPKKKSSSLPGLSSCLQLCLRKLVLLWSTLTQIYWPIWEDMILGVVWRARGQQLWDTILISTDHAASRTMFSICQGSNMRSDTACESFCLHSLARCLEHSRLATKFIERVEILLLSNPQMPEKWSAQPIRCGFFADSHPEPCHFFGIPYHVIHIQSLSRNSPHSAWYSSGSQPSLQWVKAQLTLRIPILFIYF